MKMRKVEFIELLLMTVVFAIASAVAALRHHPRASFMIVLTVCSAVITFLAQIRERRAVETPQGVGHRLPREAAKKEDEE